MIELRTLGTIDLRGSGGASIEAVLAQPRRLALLVFLANVRDGTDSAFARRDALLAMFWPESREAAARTALKQAIYFLRRTVGQNVIVSRGATELGIERSELTCDVQRFEDALDSGRVAEAADLYRGDFLDAFHVAGSPGFLEWMDGERQRLRTRYAHALEQLAEEAEASAEWSSACAWWRKAAALDPLSSRVALALVRALAAAAERSAALQAASVHSALIRDELGIEPDPAFLALVENIRNEVPRTQRLVAPPVAAPLETAAGKTPAAPQTPDRGTARSHAYDEQVAGGSRHASRWWNALAAGVALTLVTAATLQVVRGRGADPPDATPSDAAVVVISNSGEAGLSEPSRRASQAVAHLLSTAVPIPVIVVPRVERSGFAGIGSSRADLVVDVRTANVGSTTGISATITDAKTGSLLWSSPLFDLRDGEMVSAIDRFAERTATAVAVRLDPAFRNWIAASSEPSHLDSYHGFRTALLFSANVDWEPAAGHLAAVLKADPAFTMAGVQFAYVNLAVGNLNAVDTLLSRLRSLNLKPHDRAIVEYLVAYSTTQDREMIYALSAAIGAAAPQSEWQFLSAKAAIRLGRAAEGLKIIDDMRPHLGWNAEGPAYWVVLSQCLHYLRQYERELAEMKAAQLRFPSNRLISQMTIKALAGLGRDEEVEQEVNRAMTLQPRFGEGQPMSQAITELHAHGRPEAARRLARRVLHWARSRPADQQAALRPWMDGFVFMAGRLDEALDMQQELIVTVPDNYIELAWLGIVLAAQGEHGEAAKLATRLDEFSNPDADMLSYRAGLAAWMGDRDSAVRLLRDALRAGAETRMIMHQRIEFQPLIGYPPFVELLSPVGS